MNKQTIKYDNLTIVQQAQNYTDVYRILAEYVDNSIDSAEELFDEATESYSRDIEITVTKSANGKKNRTITITDNACGMRISPNGEYTIFKSDKKEDPCTNGMYGMGMFSFLSICEKMSVDTRKKFSNFL
ncbi:MAG: ATP-binding protein [Ignavibacteria bacterium]|nr:ATP-binding protein [Ignavibacteria bacterium]